MPDRPDPDALLARVKSEEARQARGKLKIFFGAAPGVGKTYAMLEAARKLAKEGADAVVGYVEPHSRPETQALVLGLDVLPKQEVLHRGARLLEFHLDAALTLRPQLMLVDELAHANAPGLTHEKRWQDVLRLLDAGIDVYTTLNVQHLESLNDIVAQITGVVVRETVPDAIFEQADEVELVDIAPDDLLERIREGNVYVAPVAERAMENFFTKGNLIALRELALRRTAERVGTQMDLYRREHAVGPTWPARERLVVCIGPTPFAARLVRATRRMAASLKAPWTAVHVETPGGARLGDEARDHLSQAMHLAEQLGGETATISGAGVAEALFDYARGRNVTKIVVGKSKQPRWRELLRHSLVHELTRTCGDIDVYVISGDPHPAPPRAAPPAAAARRYRGYAGAAVVVAGCTLLCALLAAYFDLAPTNFVMIYLLGLVAVALRFGRGPSILAALLSVPAFNFFFVPPRWTFAVQDPQYLLTFTVMLVTGLVISNLVARVRLQAEAARGRERRTAALFALSRELEATQGREQIARTAVRHVCDATDARAVVLLSSKDGQLVPLGADVGGFEPTSHDMAVARWVCEHGEKAGRRTATLPGAEGLYLPLSASHGTLGALGVLPGDANRVADVEQLHLLETFAGLTALALERADLAAEAARIRVDMETERLRSSLLSAVSHDLRTPLSVVTGASSTLLDGDELDPAVRRELAASILAEAERLNRLVGNLLDMTRLQAGALAANKQWQPIEEVIGAALERTCRQLPDRAVTARLQPELPFVPLDDLLIQQVLVNLLENVARHTPPGTPVEVGAQQDGLSIVVEVADRGPGLPAVDSQRLFDKFYRAGEGNQRPGAGLGLAICRGIVELHGGRITAANRPGGGTVFRFTLPLEGQPPMQDTDVMPSLPPGEG